MAGLPDDFVPPQPAPEALDGEGPRDGAEPPAPPEPPRPRFYERPGFRSAVWIVAVFLALLLIGVVFTPRYWRF